MVCIIDGIDMNHSRAKSAIFLSLLIIVMDVSAGASMANQNSVSGVEEWPSHEMPSDASDPVEEPGWWLSFGYDTNSNGMDDRLESIIYGSSESISPTSVVGPDGRKTVAVVINYAWHPGESDANSLNSTLLGHGWTPEGSFFFIMDILDSIVVDRVPVSALNDILSLSGVVLVEQQTIHQCIQCTTVLDNEGFVGV